MTWPAFTHPWLLAGLLAVGLPVLIHYLTRARPQRIAFPPFKFLTAAAAGQQALHRLRTILLLIIRCLLILALVFLFARPFLKPRGAGVNPAAEKRVVLVIDASLSMRAVQDGVPLFTRAQAEAAEVLRGLPAGTEAAVILAGAQPRSLLPARSENIPALHDELVNARPTYENGAPAAALALAQKMLDGAGTIYIFSDFQKANWEGAGELPGGCTCRLRPVTTAAVDNVAITAAQLMPAAPVIGEPVEAACTVANHTPQPRAETVRLELGEITRETRVAIAPFGTAVARFNLDFAQAGAYAGQVSLAPDALPEDNTRFLAAKVSPALKILLISDADETDWHSAAFYVGHALVPSPQAAPGLKLTRRRSQDLDRGLLETADVFVLAAPATLSGEGQEIITRRVLAGARLITLLDGPTAPALMLPGLTPPFQLQRVVESAPGEAVTPGARPLFTDLYPGDFAGLHFYRHYQTQLLDQRAGDVLLSYPDGSAALTLSPAGQGAMVLVNLPLTPTGGDFVGSPIFPALLHESLRWLRQDATEHGTMPGTAWLMDVPTSGEDAVKVTDPAGKPLAAQVITSGRNTRLALPPATLPGTYAFKQANAVVAYAVVNVDPRESDLRPLALDTLKSGAGAAVTVLRGEDELAPASQTRQLWPQFAAAAAGLLALEMLLLAGWRSPKHAPAAAPSTREVAP